jgi:hypothetical protein
VTLFGPGLYTSSVSQAYQPGAAGVRFFLNVSSIGPAGASVQLVVQKYDPMAQEGFSVATWQTPAITAPGLYELTIYPGVQTVVGQTTSDTLGGLILAALAIDGLTPQVECSLCAVPIG